MRCRGDTRCVQRALSWNWNPHALGTCRPLFVPVQIDELCAGLPTLVEALGPDLEDGHRAAGE